jgi:hypothetical protein
MYQGFKRFIKKSEKKLCVVFIFLLSRCKIFCKNVVQTVAGQQNLPFLKTGINDQTPYLRN